MKQKTGSFLKYAASRVSFYLGDFTQGTVKDELAESLRTQVFIEHLRHCNLSCKSLVKTGPSVAFIAPDALFGGLASST